MRSMKMEEEREESETTDLWTADEECQEDKTSHTPLFIPPPLQGWSLNFFFSLCV